MTTNLPTLNAYLGGSFDPPHFGHLTMLACVYDTLLSAKQTGQINNFTAQFVPTKANPFKHNQTATHHRLAMLTLALQDKPLLNKSIKINTIETDNPDNTPSFTADTLTTLSTNAPNEHHLWVMGFDSLISLPSWKNYNKINELSNLWVFWRPDDNTSLDQAIAQLPPQLHTKLTFCLNELYQTPTGKIFIDQRPIPTISSTQIRQALANSTHTTTLISQFVPLSVATYAKTHHLYN